MKDSDSCRRMNGILHQDLEQQEDQSTTTIAADEAGLKNFPSIFKYRLDVDESEVDVPRVYTPYNKTLCDLLLGKKDDHGFDYYSDYLDFRYNEELKILNFILVQVSLNYSSPSKSLPPIISTTDDGLHLPSDEQLKESQQQRFGPLDYERDVEAQEEFRRFKQHVSLEYKSQIVEANSIIKHEQRLNPTAEKSPSHLNSLIDRIIQEMMPIKPRYSNKVKKNPSTNILIGGIEPYVLPRPRPLKFIRDSKNILQKFPREIDNEKLQKNYESMSGKFNLAVCDPLLRSLKALQLTRHLKFPLAGSILRVLNKYPMGMSPTTLYQKFHCENGYEIDYQTLGFESFGQLLEENESLFTMVKSEDGGPTVVYSSFLEVNRCGDQIHKNIFHWILVTLHLLKKPVPLDELSQQLNKTFNLGLDIEAWGWTEQKYYQNLVGAWGINLVELFEIPDSTPGSELAPALGIKLLDY